MKRTLIGAAVILGVAIMVSDAFTGRVSPIGDGLALLIATSLSIATVITRRYSHVGMTPATCLAALLAALLALTQATSLAVSARDMGFLFAFGAVNLGLGLACFASGARLIPAAMASCLRRAPSSAAASSSLPCSSISGWSSGASASRRGRGRSACLRPTDLTLRQGRFGGLKPLMRPNLTLVASGKQKYADFMRNLAGRCKGARVGHLKRRTP